ncbi:hypothetical protein SEA_MUFASA8_99 [Arthrobacter phage Mufasa8]|uniref:DUF2786 domain-containing protein n=1 Tax=Arthrobacter phage Mufasa8 TaxID=2656526 RepID=A0A649VMA9_9CAUD|nr:hypothetical protein HYQ08_gp099 [Arthrobacter phage Mufasa8]QGJ93546.1 hypothetical protein SEA_MUFASA8_99 [Arthrobacter phage Mufasa8]
MANLDKQLDKIAKLLRKAESTPYPAEAEALREHAERLMIRYGIDKAAVDMERGRQGQTREPITQKHMVVSGSYQINQLNGLTATLTESRLVTCLQTTHSADGYRVLYVVGAESDVDQMLRLAESLLIQQDHALRTWWAVAGKDKGWMTETERLNERKEFVLGFYAGAALRLREIVGEEVSATGSGELVLVDRKSRADDWIAQKYPKIKAAREQKIARGTAEATRAGVVEGKKADVNGKKVEARKAAAALSAAVS